MIPGMGQVDPESGEQTNKKIHIFLSKILFNNNHKTYYDISVTLIAIWNNKFD
jgi:hypothetical protein